MQTRDEEHATAPFVAEHRYRFSSRGDETGERVERTDQQISKEKDQIKYVRVGKKLIVESPCYPMVNKRQRKNVALPLLHGRFVLSSTQESS